MIDEARSTTDVAKREALYSQITQYTKDKAYFMQVPTAIDVNAIHDNLQGYEENLNPLMGYQWKDLSKTQ